MGDELYRREYNGCTRESLSMASDDTKLTLLHAHYTQTFDDIRRWLRRRDKLFVVLLVVVAITAFRTATPEEATKVISEAIHSRFDIDALPSQRVFGHLLWFLALAVSLPYYQAVVRTERLYSYIHKLEEELSKNFPSPAFTREGRSYLNDYPLFSKWATFLYTVAFPATLMAVLVWTIRSQSKGVSASVVGDAFDVLMFGAIALSTGLYVLVLHPRKGKSKTSREAIEKRDAVDAQGETNNERR